MTVARLLMATYAATAGCSTAGVVLATGVPLTWKLSDLAYATAHNLLTVVGTWTAALGLKQPAAMITLIVH